MVEQADASSVHCCEVEESVAVPEDAEEYEIKEPYVGRESKPYYVGLGKAYAKIFALAVGFFLIDIPFFLLSSLTTSFSVDLGAFSLGAMYVAFTSFLFVAPSLVVMLGSKTCCWKWFRRTGILPGVLVSKLVYSPAGILCNGRQFSVGVHCFGCNQER